MQARGPAVSPLHDASSPPTKYIDRAMSTSPLPLELKETEDQTHEENVEAKTNEVPEPETAKESSQATSSANDEDETVKKPSRISRTRIKDLEAALAALHKERRDMFTDIDLYKRDIVGFKKDISRRDAQILELQQHTATPSLELDSLRAANARIAEELRLHKTAANAVISARDAEISRLEEVVGGLKMCISTSTRVEEAVGDEVFRDAWGRIGYDVVNWCLTNGAVKGGRVDVGSLDAEVRAVLERAVPGHDGLVGDGRRVHVVQAVMADVLMREVFKGWFLGLEEGRDVALKGLEGMFTNTASSASLNSWRASTLTLLRTHLLATSAVLTELTTHITNALLTCTTPLLPTPPSTSREKSLTAIVDATIRIATLMRCQRARFQIQDIPVGVKWDAETMEDLTGEEEDGSVVGCVAWPGVEKCGDEMGEGKEVRCVVRARVVCVEPGEGA